MIFTIAVQDTRIIDNNGSSIVLLHHKHAIEELGHTVHFINLNDEIPESDYIIVQSEWYKHRRWPDNLIVWIGHFQPNRKYRMPELSKIRAKAYFTQWTGECVKFAESKVGKPIFYFPHAVCSCNTEGKVISSPRTLFIGANYKERSQDWLDYAGVPRIQCQHEVAKNYYKSALVSPNLHGAFQLNQKTEYMEIPGRMVNDRAFNIIASGGFCVSDNEMMRDFIDIPIAETKEEYKRLIDYYVNNPEERLPIMEKAKKQLPTYKEYYKKLIETL